MGYYNRSTLINERNWTPDLIENYLGKADSYSPNPCNKNKSVQLYLINRVEKAELDARFLEEQKELLLTKATKISTESKTIKISCGINTIVDVVLLLDIKDIHVLETEAKNHYNIKHRQEIENNYKQKIEDLNYQTSFGNRIIRNYLRHCCSSYHSSNIQYYGLCRLPGSYKRIKEELEIFIDENYPELDLVYSY